MKNRKTYGYLFSLFFSFTLLLSFLSSGQNPLNDKTPIKIGVSQINITPEEPVMMSGYEARKTPSTGVHDSLFASALYFAGEKNKVLIITTDLIGFSAAMIDDFKKSIESKTGVPSANIMISAVHNHGGPSTRAY